MYIPEKYRNQDADEIRDFLREHSFGILVSAAQDGPQATHLPLEFEEHASGFGVLRGHFARANPQWQHIPEGSEVLCIFNGPHAYVSSSWYQEEEVPTWNYMAVHVRGNYRTQNEEELWESLHKLMDKYEKDSRTPVSLHDLSPATLRQVRGIVGFEIAITRLEAAYKLSQGREQDHPRIVEELHKRGGQSRAVATAMKRNPPS
jgi:transcriptional regulator